MAVAGGKAQEELAGELAEQVAAAREVALSLVRWGADVTFEAKIEERQYCSAYMAGVLQSWSADETFARRLTVSCVGFLFFSSSSATVSGNERRLCPLDWSQAAGDVSERLRVPG